MEKIQLIQYHINHHNLIFYLPSLFVIMESSSPNCRSRTQGGNAHTCFVTKPFLESILKYDRGGFVTDMRAFAFVNETTITDRPTMSKW